MCQCVITRKRRQDATLRRRNRCGRGDQSVSKSRTRHRRRKVRIAKIYAHLLNKELISACLVRMEHNKLTRLPILLCVVRPYILCLDSLGGTHPTVFKVLRSYLQQELLARKGLEMVLTTKEIAGKYSSRVSMMLSNFALCYFSCSKGVMSFAGFSTDAS